MNLTKFKETYSVFLVAILLIVALSSITFMDIVNATNSPISDTIGDDLDVAINNEDTKADNKQKSILTNADKKIVEDIVGKDKLEDTVTQIDHSC